MPKFTQEKEWEIRRLASKALHVILTDAGNIDDARLVAALTLNILMKPTPLPVDRGADLIRLVVGVG